MAASSASATGGGTKLLVTGSSGRRRGQAARGRFSRACRSRARRSVERARAGRQGQGQHERPLCGCLCQSHLGSAGAGRQPEQGGGLGVDRTHQNYQEDAQSRLERAADSVRGAPGARLHLRAAWNGSGFFCVLLCLSPVSACWLVGGCVVVVGGVFFVLFCFVLCFVGHRFVSLSRRMLCSPD